MAQPIRQFFAKNGLPWNTSIEQSLHEDGYDTVELLKVMEEEEWSALFTKEKKAKQRLALSVFRDLKDQPVNPSNCATEIPFNSPTSETSETTASASSASSKKKRKKNHTDNNNDTHKMERFGFFLKKHKKAIPNQHWSNPLHADDEPLFHHLVNNVLIGLLRPGIRLPKNFVQRLGLRAGTRQNNN